MVVVDKMLHVLEEHNGGLLCAYYAAYLEEERASRVLEAFLLARYAKRLAWETSTENVMVRNVILAYLFDVPQRHLPEIGVIVSLAFLVNLRRHHTLEAVLLHSYAYTPYTSEKVDETCQCISVVFRCKVMH